MIFLRLCLWTTEIDEAVGKNVYAGPTLNKKN
jgi:hypothetical protein